MISSSENFYEALPILKSYLDVADENNYSSVPNDWYVIVSDVISSTKAITDGKYKEVNILGAALISAVRNIAKPLEIPFVFGGDGASLCIPPRFFTECKSIINSFKELALSEFGLKYRTGIIKVEEINNDGYHIKIAKFAVSKHYNQSVFSGGGLEYAEMLLKDNRLENTDSNNNFSYAELNFDGLECRWNAVPSKYGQTVSILVKALSDNSIERTKIYQEVILEIYSIYEEKNCHPLSIENLKTTFSKTKLALETKIRTFGKGTFFNYFTRQCCV